MEVKVKKLTDVALLRKANSFTTGKGSMMTLEKAYKLGHSPIRTQLFWVEMHDIPLHVASQLVRSHVGVQFFQLTKRPDRGGEDFTDACESIYSMIRNLKPDDEGSREAVGSEIRGLPYRFDRNAPTDLACLINAESLINISRKRLCASASVSTRHVWGTVVREVGIVDPALAPYLVPQCVHDGFCRENKPCGLCETEAFKKQRKSYVKLFDKQEKQE